MPALTLSDLPVLDDYSVLAAWGIFDKADLLPVGGSIRVQVNVNGAWQPEAGKLFRAGLPVSWTGLIDIWPPGPTQLRAKRATPGAGATVDLDLYSAG